MKLVLLVSIIRDGKVIDKFLFQNLEDVKASLSITCCNTSNKLRLEFQTAYLSNILDSNDTKVGEVEAMEILTEPTHL